MSLFNSKDFMESIKYNRPEITYIDCHVSLNVHDVFVHSQLPTGPVKS